MTSNVGEINTSTTPSLTQKPSWHFVMIVLDTHLKQYSGGADLVILLKRLAALQVSDRPNIVVDLLWDCEQFKNNSVVAHFDKTTGLSYERLERTQFHAKMIGEFTNKSTTGVPRATNTVFSIFCHGMGFYYRHDARVFDVANLFKDMTTKFDVIILESCYLATVEVVYELRDRCDYFLASEGSHNRLVSWKLELFDGTQTLQEFLENFCKVAIEKNFEGEIGQIYRPVMDYSVINMSAFKQLWAWMKRNRPDLRNVPMWAWKKYKIEGKLHHNYCPTYDLYGIAVTAYSGDNLDKFKQLFEATVIGQCMTPLSAEKYRYKLYGLAWSPVPWDMKHGWSYKYLSIYPEAENVILLPRDLIM